MSKITTIFFDLGGVVATNGWDRNSRKVAVEKFGLDAEEYDKLHKSVATDMECGRMTLEQYMDKTIFYKNRSFKREEFRQFVLDQSYKIPEGFKLLEEVHKSGRFLLCTLNNESIDINAYRIEKFELRKYFTHFVSSCFVGHKKPEAEIFHIAVNITQKKPEECLFIDDREYNLEVPRKMGMNTILCKDPAQLRKEMDQLGILGACCV